MANTSIYSAFERFWLHVVAAVGEKADSSIVNSHTSDKENPHEVSLSQLGVTVSADTLNYMEGVTSKVQTQLNNRVEKVEGMGLSTNDYTTEEKNKLDALPDPETSQSGELVPFSEYTEDEIQALWDSVTV